VPPCRFRIMQARSSLGLSHSASLPLSPDPLSPPGVCRPVRRRWVCRCSRWPSGRSSSPATSAPPRPSTQRSVTYPSPA
jgi:hypothetical protein